MSAANSTPRTPGQILMESTVYGSEWSKQTEATQAKWERHANEVCGSIAEELRRAFVERDKLWTAIHRLRDLRDALVDSMERQGGIPMTDALADALVACGVDITGKRELEVICENCLSRATCPSFKEGYACMYHIVAPINEGGAA